MTHKPPMTNAGRAAYLSLGIASVVLVAHLAAFGLIDSFDASLMWLVWVIYAAVGVSTVAGVAALVMGRQHRYQDTNSPAMTGLAMNLIFVIVAYANGALGLGPMHDPEADRILAERIVGAWGADEQIPGGKMQTARLRLDNDRAFIFRAHDTSLEVTVVGDMSGIWSVSYGRLELSVLESRVGDAETVGNTIIWPIRYIDDNTIRVNNIDFKRINLSTGETESG